MSDQGTLADRVLAMARRLPKDDFEAINLNYGIDGDPHDLAGIAKKLSVTYKLRVTKENARQWLEGSLRRLLLALSDEEVTRDNLADLIIAGRMRENERENRRVTMPKAATTSNLTAFAARLKALRARRGVSQRWLAREAGITHGAIAALEVAKCCPSAALLARLADVFGLTMDELWHGIGKCEGVGVSRDGKNGATHA